MRNTKEKLFNECKKINKYDAFTVSFFFLNLRYKGIKSIPAYNVLK